MKRHLLSICLLSISVAACGPMKTSLSQPSNEELQKVAYPRPLLPNVTPPEGFALPIPPEAHEEAITKANVRCEDEASCPPSVGMLVAKNGRMLTTCTSFLISDRLVLTNSHCIPDELKVSGASCREKLQIFFPDAGVYLAARVGCERILTHSKIPQSGQPDYTMKPDYALIQLSDDVKRPPLAVDRAGIEDNQTLRALTIDPQSRSRVEGLVRVKTCVARQSNAAVPSFTQPFAPIALTACDIISGNSGSPAIDEQGRVRAIVHASMDPATHTDDNGEVVKFRAMGLMTNLACVSLPPEAGSLAMKPHPDCAKVKTQQELVEEKIAKADFKDLQPLISAWTEKAPKSIHYESTKTEPAEAGDVATLSPQIICIRDPKLWHDAKQAGPAKITYVLPFWGFAAQFDEEYRVVIKPAVLEEVRIVMELNPDELSKKGWVYAHALITSRNSGDTNRDDKFVLNLCKD